MIKVTDVVKNYGSIRALDSLSLDIGANQIFGLLGVNGAGKTTLLSALNGLLKVDAGEIEVFGLDVKKDISAIKNISSIIPQHLAFYERLTVKENLEFFSRIQKSSVATVDRAIEINSLEPLLNQTSATLSGGQKKRLNIAIGLLNSPKIIYFDEPTVGVDVKSRNEILDSIKSYKDIGITVVYTSHYMMEIERICDEVAILSRGKVIEQGPLDSMISNCVSDKVMIELILKEKTVLDNDMVIEQPIIKTTEKELPEVLQKLKRNNVPVKQVRFGAADLEDYFLEATEESSL